jgi:hypothetical protein
LLAVLAAVVLAGCGGTPGGGPGDAATDSARAASPTATPTDAPSTTPPSGTPTAAATYPPSPTLPEIPEGTHLVGPMAPSCRTGDGGWRYRQTDRDVRQVEESWRDAEGALSIASTELGMDDEPTVELALLERNVSGVGWKGDVVDVAATDGADRNVLAEASVTDGSLSVLVLGYDDRTELVVYRVFNVC